MLFINRRGFSSFVMCTKCGYVAKCTDCDVSLTYHSEENELRCHYCGKRYRMFDLCPHCKSEFTLTAGQNGITCSRCGMTAVMDEYCRFVSGRFATIAEWYRFQEGALEQNFEKTSLETAVIVKKIDKKKKRMEVCGSGV